MAIRRLKTKYIFLGDCNSINIEIIEKSFSFLKKKVKYILIGNNKDLKKYLIKIRSKLKINEIINPLDFNECNSSYLNLFNVENVSTKKFQNLLNQISIANYLSNQTKIDLVTMPINKSIFKTKFIFIGMTEYLGYLNNKKTIMIMRGEKFSIIPFTTHINPKDIYLNIKSNKITEFLKILLKYLKRKDYGLNFKIIKFLCYNPHCSENKTLGVEDNIITKVLLKFKVILGPFPADSAFKNIKKNSLFISTYHDQALIPFKILNKKSFNLTLGLNYRRLSPAHGTAKDIKYKNKSDSSSYLACMEI